MDFRCIALLAVWTLISGPMFDAPPAPATAASPSATPAEVVKFVKTAERP